MALSFALSGGLRILSIPPAKLHGTRSSRGGLKRSMYGALLRRGLKSEVAEGRAFEKLLRSG